MYVGVYQRNGLEEQIVVPLLQTKILRALDISMR